MQGCGRYEGIWERERDLGDEGNEERYSRERGKI